MSLSLDHDILSVAHHPTRAEFAVSLVTGHVHVYAHDPICRLLWSTKRHKKACRSIAYSLDGASLVSVGAERVIKKADARTGKVTQKWIDAHDDDINVVTWANDAVFCTGDDSGVVKAWDSTGKALRVFTTHSDFISSLLPLDGKFILSTSGDGTLSVHDLRSTKNVCVKQSDDQEDDLTSCVMVKSGSKKPKVCVGTSSGVISIFNKGDWGDNNDRILPPHGNKKVVEEIGVECLAKVNDNTIVVGGADGKVRLLQVLPNQYLRVLGDFENGEPVEGVTVYEDLVFAVSGPKLFIWNIHDTAEKAQEKEEEEKEEEESDGDQFSESSDEEEEPPQRKKPKKSKTVIQEKKDTFFDDL